MRVVRIKLLLDGRDGVLGRDLARPDGVADVQDGDPVRLEEQVGGRSLQQPIKRGRRTKHFSVFNSR